MKITFIFLLGILLIVAGTWLIIRGRKHRHNQPKSTRVVKKSDILEKKTGSKEPDRIVIGSNPQLPVMIIQSVSEDKGLDNSKILDIKGDRVISRLGAALQAVPSLLVAGEASGKTLMEVVINGDMVRATDGSGFRAFAMNGNRISEHARLFEVDDLQNLINAAAVWQVASVVVAQKHLADISRKLDEIKAEVEHISQFLENQRKARILSAYDYIWQIYLSIKNCEFSSSSQIELERCERDLSEIQYHLEMEFRQKVDKKVEHTETWGTEQLTKDIGKKISDLEAISDDIAICLKTRIAAWHVLSLFPGNYQYKARQESILKSIRSFSELGPYFEEKITSEINSIDSMWNWNSTLSERRRNLKYKCIDATNSFGNVANKNLEYVSKNADLLLEKDQTTCMYLEFENGCLTGARQKNELAGIYNVTPPNLQPAQ